MDLYQLMQPWTADTPQKGDHNSDGILTPADAAIALRFVATDADDLAADVSRNDRVTSPMRMNDPAGGSQANRVVKHFDMRDAYPALWSRSPE